MQSADKQVDDTAEKLKELARRQQQEIERQRRAMQSGGGGAGSSDLQRQLAQEAEELARRLQQLTREQQKQNVADASRQLQEAANQMRQAAAGGQNSESLARSAMDKIQEAQRKLQQNQTGRAERDVQDALRKAEELASEQKQVQSEVAGLSGQPDASRQARAKALTERKKEMDGKVENLQPQLEQIANEARRDDRAAARKLDEAAGTVTDKRIREKIRYTQNALQAGMGGQSDYMRSVGQIEEQLSADLDTLRQRVADAQ